MTPLDDYWEASSLSHVTVDSFARQVQSFLPTVGAVNPLASAGAPIPLKRVDDRLQRLFHARRSGRVFGDDPLAERQVEAVLAATACSPGDGRPATPSAGDLRSVQLFAIGMNTAGPTAGRVVRYDPTGHALFDVAAAPSPEVLQQLFSLDCDGVPQLVLIFVVVPGDMRRKYGDRAGRFWSQEVGHAAQNIGLRLAHERLAGYVLGGALDFEIGLLLRIGHLDALVAGAMAIGVPPEGKRRQTRRL